jgi:hypothetical protein
VDALFFENARADTKTCVGKDHESPHTIPRRMSRIRGQNVARMPNHKLYIESSASLGEKYSSYEAREVMMGMQRVYVSLDLDITHLVITFLARHVNAARWDQKTAKVECGSLLMNEHQLAPTSSST